MVIFQLQTAQGSHRPKRARGIEGMARTAFPEPSARRDQRTGLRGAMRAGAKAAAGCVGDAVSPLPPC